MKARSYLVFCPLDGTFFSGSGFRETTRIAIDEIGIGNGIVTTSRCFFAAQFERAECLDSTRLFKIQKDF
jgi:hypothetical protein